MVQMWRGDERHGRYPVGAWKDETRLSGGSRGPSGWRDRWKGRGCRGAVKFKANTLTVGITTHHPGSGQIGNECRGCSAQGKKGKDSMRRGVMKMGREGGDQRRNHPMRFGRKPQEDVYTWTKSKNDFPDCLDILGHRVIYVLAKR